MPKGTIDFLPDMFANVAAWLPNGVTIVSAQTYGGAVRATIQGNGISEGATYQMIVTEGEMKRTIELVEADNGNVQV